GVFKCNFGETVLDDFELSPRAAHFPAEVTHLRYGHAFVARHHDRAACLEDVVEGLNHLPFFSSIHRFSPVNWRGAIICEPPLRSRRSPVKVSDSSYLSRGVMRRDPPTSRGWPPRSTAIRLPSHAGFN